MDGRVNTVDVPSTSHKKIVNFGPFYEVSLYTPRRKCIIHHTHYLKSRHDHMLWSYYHAHFVTMQAHRTCTIGRLANFSGHGKGRVAYRYIRLCLASVSYTHLTLPTNREV